MLKAAVIGLGWWGKHIIRYLKSSDRISIIAAVDTNPVAVHSFAAEYGIPLTDKFEDVLDDAAVDAVILTTPHGFHEQQVIAAANAGKQVFCEKPLTLTVDAAERMLRACDDAGIILGIGHERRYEPALEEIKRRVDAGEAGTLMHIEINCSYPLFAAEAGSDWRRDPAHAPAGALTALGVHMTDYMQTLAGDATRIYAQLSDRTRDCPLDDVLAVHLTFASGATGYLCAIASTPFHQH
ncbi:MAG: Gfo/Idh/MocA family oxidoreductase, partial [Rhodospirillales bacterium]|nr:Gfo/Idh/MocA family oxidoreductase [Rhodospirillales bacterium]